jgi:hypothetical protein
MDASILPVLSQARIPRGNVRLWTAHYDVGEHICGPDSCGMLSINADGTQWTPNAHGLVLDQSELAEDFFTNEPAVTTEAELQSGQLNDGKGAVTAITVPPGTAHHIAFGADNGVQNQPPAQLRVAIYDTEWHVTKDLVVNGNKGASVLTFPDPSKTGVISVVRMDAGVVEVGYVVY